MKKHIKTWISFTLAALLLAAPAAALEFTDSASITNQEAVSALVELGVISGKPDGSFDPNGQVTRAELAKMLSLLLEPRGGQYPAAGFTDTADSWARQYIDHCYSLKIIAGRGDGRFDPESAVTGTEAAKMVLVAGGRDPSGFAGAAWAERTDTAAKAAGLYEGVATAPGAPLTRDGAARLLYNGLKLLEDRTVELGFTTSGIAVMPDGSLLLTDTFSRVVRRVQNGEVSLYAGSVTAADINGRPVGGYTDGAAGSSAFQYPWAIVPFLGGYAVSDAENNVLRLIQNGQVQTLNPSGMEDGVRFAYPTGLASAEDGFLYVSDTHNGAIRRISAKGELTTVADGLKDPMGLCWAGGSLYVAETGANRILRLKDGKLTVVAGSGEEGFQDGPAEDADFSAPQCVAVAEDGTVYVSDTANSAVRRIRGGQVDTILTRDLADPESGHPVSPAGLALVGGRLYVCDSFTGTLLVLRV